MWSINKLLDTHAKNVLSIQSRSEDITEKVGENGFKKSIWDSPNLYFKDTLKHIGTWFKCFEIVNFDTKKIGKLFKNL